MPLIQYKTINFRMASRMLIRKINDIIIEYRNAGYSLTLRQVYYQLVSRDIVPNNERSYNNVGNLISDARLAGIIDWYAIEDRTRFIRGGGGMDDPMSIFTDLDKQFSRDWLEGQPNYLEVWVEKDALIDIVGQLCAQYNVPYFSCRGYTSQTEMWNASQRIARATEDDSRPVRIIHLGDHDPSGKDMTRDIKDRISMFLFGDDDPDRATGDFDFQIDRIALNMDQIKQYSPPPNPAKITDSRAKAYIAEFGAESWELDALEPRVLTELIDKSLKSYLDLDMIEAVKERQEEERSQIRTVMHFARNQDDFVDLEDGNHDLLKDFMSRSEDFIDLSESENVDIKDHYRNRKNWITVEECKKRHAKKKEA